MCYVKFFTPVLCYVLLCENRNFSCYVMLCVMISFFTLEHGIFTVNIWKSAFKFIKKLLLGKVVKYTVLERNSYYCTVSGRVLRNVSGQCKVLKLEGPKG